MSAEEKIDPNDTSSQIEHTIPLEKEEFDELKRGGLTLEKDTLQPYL